VYKLQFITRHSLVRVKGEVFVLFYCFYVCLFGQRFLYKTTTRGPIHAKVCMRAYSGSGCACLIPFWGLAAPGERKKGGMKFSLLWESMVNFCILAVLEQYLSNAWTGRIHTKFYLCRDNVCRRAPSPCWVHRPRGGVAGGGVKNSKNWGVVSFVQIANISIFLSVAKCDQICRAQTCAHSGIDRTVKIGQGVSTGCAKKFEKISNFSPFRDFTSIFLRNY